MVSSGIPHVLVSPVWHFVCGLLKGVGGVWPGSVPYKWAGGARAALPHPNAMQWGAPAPHSREKCPYQKSGKDAGQMVTGHPRQ